MKLAALLAELRRRNVLRAGALYVGSVWALAQGLAQLFPVFGVPDWVVRWIVVAALIGFPFFLAFAWFYEFTPGGLKRESAIDPSDAVAHSSGRRLDFWIIGVLALAIVLLLANQLVVRKTAAGEDGERAAKTIAETPVSTSEKSIAVLPLTNESGDTSQQYFSDGLSEELISDLTQITELKVIGRYSSFKFRDSKDSPAQIGAALGVAHLLSGSVRQQGEHVRIQVDLIKAADGSSLWSHTYDRDLKDVFAIQSEISHAVAGALKIQLLGHTVITDDQPPSGSARAYQLMLQGRALRRLHTEADLRQGIALQQEALKLDPDYAYAWTVVGNIWINLGHFFLRGDEQQTAYANGRTAIDKALALAPDSPASLRGHAYLLQVVDGDPLTALAENRRALKLGPNDGTSMSFLAINLLALGQTQAGIELYRRALATDPLRVEWQVNLADALIAQNQLDEAERTLLAALALQPSYTEINSSLTTIDVLRGDAAAAQIGAQRETDPDKKSWLLVLAAQIGHDPAGADLALHDYTAKNEKKNQLGIADLHALRREPDAMFAWLDRAWVAHDPQLGNLLQDPFILRYKDDPRFAALCKKIGLPAPGAPPSVAPDSPVPRSPSLAKGQP